MLLDHRGERDSDEEEGSRKVDSSVEASRLSAMCQVPASQSEPCFPTSMR
jgi:hypothetical protein